MYEKNYGSGNPWLPGKVVKTLGSSMYTVLLNDGRNVCEQADQMRPRVDGTATSSTATSGDSLEMRVPRLNEESSHSDNNQSKAMN